MLLLSLHMNNSMFSLHSVGCKICTFFQSVIFSKLYIHWVILRNNSFKCLYRFYKSLMSIPYLMFNKLIIYTDMIFASVGPFCIFHQQ